MSETHRHRPKTTREALYAGPVAHPENEAAHGNIVSIATCRCGAERRTNVNGRHIERGPWVEP